MMNCSSGVSILRLRMLNIVTLRILALLPCDGQASDPADCYAAYRGVRTFRIPDIARIPMSILVRVQHKGQMTIPSRVRSALVWLTATWWK